MSIVARPQYKPATPIRQSLPCVHCRTPTLHERDPSSVNHILHFLISVLTIGVWVVVWASLASHAPKRLMRCTACGTPYERTPVRLPPRADGR